MNALDSPHVSAAAHRRRVHRGWDWVSSSPRSMPSSPNSPRSGDTLAAALALACSAGAAQAAATIVIVNLNEAGVGDAEELGESRLSTWSSEGRPTDTTERKRAPGLGHPSNFSNLPGTTASYGRGAHARLGSARNTPGDDAVDGRETSAHAKGMVAGRTRQVLT